MESSTLMLVCQEQKGIVTNISNFICQYNGNIINFEQHTDTKSWLFLVHWRMVAERFPDPTNPK